MMLKQIYRYLVGGKACIKVFIVTEAALTVARAELEDKCRH